MERTNREPVGPGSVDEKTFLWRNAIVFALFLVLVIVGVLTVLVPELRNEERSPATDARRQAPPAK